MDTLARTDAGRSPLQLATTPLGPSRRAGAKLGLRNQTPPEYELGSRGSCRSCTCVLPFDHLC